MRFAKFPLIALFSAAPLLALAEPVPFNDDNWVYIMGAQPVDRNGQQALQLGVAATGAFFGFDMAIAKIAPFTNGIVEYDIEFTKGRTFGGVRFRIQGQDDFEDFYMRGHQSGNPDATQYMPQYNGVPSWQLFAGPSYSAPVEFTEGWNRVKLVISGDLMDVFINDMATPAFTTAPQRDEKTGGIALWGLTLGGEVWIANVDISPMDDVETIGTMVPEPIASDATVMNWQVSNTFARSDANGDLSNLTFTELSAETSGMLNLSKLQGVSEGQDTAYARVIIQSDSAQTKLFELGFSDVATVFLNGQPLFTGNDSAFSRDYRFLGTIGWWDSVYLNLVEGENELLIAVSESVGDKTGWAVQGRFMDMDGVSYK